MAQEWYLMSSPYNQLSGFEGEILDDYGEEGFSELLLEIGVDVELCNADLSECIPIRVVISSRTQDTKLNDFCRHILAKIGTLKSGLYVKYKDNYWLIESIVDNNGVYEKAVMRFCNWKIAWFNHNNQVIERYVYIQSASQYNNGQRESRYFTVQTDQLLISMPDDEESLMIDVGKRFIIDKRIIYYEKKIPVDVDIDTSFRLDIYRITRLDGVLYHYGNSGYHEIMITQDEQDSRDGFYRIDGKGYWLCVDSADVKKASSDESVPESFEIFGESNVIYIGNGAYSYSPICRDNNGDIIDVANLSWSIECSFTDDLEVDYIGDTITIAVNNSKLFNKSFELILLNDSVEVCRKNIKIKTII